MTTTTLIIATVAFAIGFALSAAAILYGYNKGRAYGWQEGFFERENYEKKRRDRQGQFKPMEN